MLQSAGSSPSAWAEALRKFPDPHLAERWKTSASLTRSWERKVAVVPALTQTTGGLVIFTQFLATQKALNGTPVARLAPTRETVCTGRDLLEVLAGNRLSTEEAGEWRKDLEVARRVIKSPVNKWR